MSERVRRSALNDAAHNVFVGVLAAALVGAAVLWLMPRRSTPIDAAVAPEQVTA